MYVTKSAEELVDKIQTASAINADKARKASDPYVRGLYTGWADALAFAADVLRDNLHHVENEARLVPENEQDPIEWLAAQMAGDWRDFPAGDAA
jgi:hypothetical protein